MKLQPGPGHSDEDVADNQRRRLLAAMVASCATRGYGETGVADLAEISGVSPRSFYQHFESKRACFTAALEGSLALAVERTLAAPAGGDWREVGRNRIIAFASFAAEQPATVRMFLVEAYAVDREASEFVEAAIAEVEQTVRERFDRSGLPESMPPEVIVGGVAATLAGVRNRLLSGQVRRLPEYGAELASFLLEFEPPAPPLRVAVRPPGQRDEESEPGDHAARAMCAFEAILAERGLAEITMGEVAKRAGMSVRTLYANFGDREELMLAAVDAAAMQAVATMLPAYRRNENPPDGVRAAFSALFGMLASRPNLAHLLLIGVREGGAAALARRAEVLRQIEPLLSGGVPPHQRPVSIRVASEALLNAVLEVAARRLTASGPGSLPGLVPICSFMILGPILGAEQATAAAAGKSYRKPPPAVSQAVVRAGRRVVNDQLLVALVAGAKTAAELTAESLLSRQEVDEQVRDLEAAGILATVGPAPGSAEERYAIVWGRMDTDESRQRSKLEREALSQEVGQVIRAELEEAVREGTFDARPDRSLVRMPLWLDDQGWSELAEHLDGAFEGSMEILVRARERLLSSGDRRAGSYGRLILTTFELPPGEDDAGPDPSDGV